MVYKHQKENDLLLKKNILFFQLAENDSNFFGVALYDIIEINSNTKADTS